MAACGDLHDLLHNGDFLTCRRCRNMCVDPLILPCLHSLCRNCVQTYYKQHGSSNDLECPQCQTKVQGQAEGAEQNGHTLLSENHFIKSLTELYECQSTSTKRHCEYCSYDKKTVTSSSRCLECHDNMCDACADAHRRTKLTRHHKIVTIEQLQRADFNVADVREHQYIECSTHCDESLKYLCRKCDQLICRECKVSAAHDKHACFELGDAIDRFRTKTEPLLQRLHDKHDGLQKYVQFLAGYSKHVNDSADDVTAQITCHAEKLHRLIDEYKDSMIQRIQDAQREDEALLEQRTTKAKAMVETLGSSCRYMDALLTHGRHDEILHTRQLVSNRLTQLLHLQADSLTKNLNLYFRPGALTTQNIETLFGKADSFYQTLNQDNVRNICVETSIDVSNAMPLLCDDVTLVREFMAKGVSDIRDIWPTGLAISKDGKIFIVDRENRRVKTYDATGHFEHEFGQSGTGHLNCPYDVTVLKTGNIAVTDYHDEDVKVFTPSGHLVTRWQHGFKYPRGISTNNDNKVLIVDVNCHQVTQHHPETGALERTLGGRLPSGCHVFTDPYYVTTNEKNFVIVTDWGSPNIKVFDDNGQLCDNFTTYGVGKDRVLQPCGICSDAYGYIFIADNKNHRVHVIGPDGKFRRFLLTEEHGLWHPMALAINHEGHLVVTEALGKVKVYKYM